jgi:hypothetical protein
MKNFIFTFLFGGLTTLSAFASDVTISNAGSKKYQVIIDGRSIATNDYYGNTITLNHLRPGQHSLQVYKGNGNSRWNGRDVVYSSDFTVRSQYDLYINVDKKGRVQMNERFNNDYGRNDGYGRNNGNWDNDRRRRYDRDNDYDNSRNDGGYNNGGYGNGGYNNGYNRAMNAADFDQLVSRVKSQWFSSGKLNTAKDGIARNYFNTAQVRQLLLLFSSDNDKLELAKLAYPQTVDQRSYSALYDVFSYQNSRDELDRFIRGNRY